MITNFKNYNSYSNYEIINEESSINDLFNTIKYFETKKEKMNFLIKQFNKTTNKILKTNILSILLILNFNLSINNLSYIKKNINNENFENVIINNENDINNICDIILNKHIHNTFPIVDIHTIKTSNEGIEFIKKYEKLKLTAYNIGDGKITIGYGHAKPIDNSKYMEGDTITLDVANELLKNDIKRKEDGVRKMLINWKKEGHHVYITQSMFDALVSMAFNMGINGLSNTEFIELLKNNKYKQAAELIKTTKVNTKYPGLYKRRLSEYELFTKEINV